MGESMIEAEHLVTAGQMLTNLGRTIQRHYPPINMIGCQFEDEQELLKELLTDHDGFYVDIGASHPVCCSNSYDLFRRGWSGILIEPLPSAWPALLMERPGDRLVPVAASNSDGYQTLHACRTVSSLREDWRDDKDESFPVRTMTLESIMNLHHDLPWRLCKFMSIDVEGSEKEVIEGIPWDRFRPDVVMIEYADQQGQDISNSWLAILIAQGYREVMRNKLNLILKLA